MHRLSEVSLAPVVALAIDVGVVHEGDAGVERSAHQLAHLVVGFLLDPHEPEDHLGNVEVGAGKGKRLHVLSLQNFG